MVRICQKTGEVILRYYGKKGLLKFKEDQSPLTCADIEAHNLLSQSLNQLPKAYPILSEESEDIAFNLRRHWKNYWLIDPLDGTQSFLDQNDEFTINIALMENNYPILGVIHAPVTKISYFGGAETRGCWRKIDNNPPKSITTKTYNRGDILRLVMSRSIASQPEKAIVSKLENHFKKIHNIFSNSAIKGGLVAEGNADLYIRHGLCFEWDVAASQAIVEAAGGITCSLSGSPILYNQQQLVVDDFLMAGDKTINWNVLICTN